MIQSILLDKQHNRVMGFYRQLLQLPEGEYTVSKISRQFGEAYNSTVALLQTVDQVICGIRDPEPAAFFSGYQVRIEEELPGLHTVFMHLAMQGIPYRFLLAVLHKDFPTLKDFSDSCGVSSSTIRRKLLPLKNYFHEMDIKLILTRMTIEGDERLIRLALQELIWRGSDGREGQLEQLELSEVDQVFTELLGSGFLDDPHLNARMGKQFAEITYSRIQGGHFVEEDEKYREGLVVHTASDGQAFQQLMKIPNANLKGELSFMYFLVFYGPTVYFEADLSSEKEKISLNKNSKLFSEYRRSLEQELFPEVFSCLGEARKQDVLLANLMNLFFDFYIFQKRLPFMIYAGEIDTIKFIQEHYRLYLTVQHFFQRLAQKEEYRWLHQILPDISTACFFLVYLHVKNDYGRKLTVSIYFDGNYLFLQAVEAFLETLDFVEYQPFSTKAAGELDIVICRTELSENEWLEATSIVFPFYTSREEYSILYSRLLTHYVSDN